MRIEKWKLDDKEVEMPIIDKDEVETNEIITSPDLDKTAEYIFDLEKEDDSNAQQ